MIQFTLNKILHEYRNEFDPPMSITEISRNTGISRHALNTLIGKTKRPRGINFDTLNKLVSFFHRPVSDFFIYTNDDIKVTLTSPKKLKGETIITVKYLHSPHGALKMEALTKLLSHHNGSPNFLCVLNELNNKNGHHNELYDSFNFDLNKYMYSYIEARILASSGLLSNKFVKSRHQIHRIHITSACSTQQIARLFFQVKQRDLLKPARKLRNGLDHSILIDSTTNHFK